MKSLSPEPTPLWASLIATFFGISLGAIKRPASNWRGATLITLTGVGGGGGGGSGGWRGFSVVLEDESLGLAFFEDEFRGYATRAVGLQGDVGGQAEAGRV